MRIEAAMAATCHCSYASGVKMRARGVLIDNSVVFMAGGFLQILIELDSGRE